MEHFKNDLYDLLTLLQQDQLRLIALTVQSKAEQSRPERVSAPQSTVAVSYKSKSDKLHKLGKNSVHDGLQYTTKFD